MHDFEFDTGSPAEPPAAPTPAVRGSEPPCRWRCGFKFVINWWLFKCLFVGLPRPDPLFWLILPWY